MSEWFVQKDTEEHRRLAERWRRCVSKTERIKYVGKNKARWSELLRLHYFDPIRFITIDPMHCLFLGIAKWIVKHLWIDGNVLLTSNLETVQSNMDKIKPP